MPRLIVPVVPRRADVSIPGLGTNVPFKLLSEKRVTKAVRDALRTLYGADRVAVSCDAHVSGEQWSGRCWIDDQQYEYRLHP